MKRYSEYKDSGVKWIGEIPGHWKKNKIMRLFTHIGSGTTPKGDQYYTDESNGIPWINSGDLNYGFLTKCNKYITEKALNDISTLKKYPINTLMIAMYGASIGKYAISHIEGCTNQACCALYGIKDELNLTYASYLMGPCKQKWIEESFGGTQPNISAEKIKQTWLPLPPLPEQEAIVTYLDSKVAKIDEYISIAEKKIAALEELKQTIIAEAVTRGIHKDVPMKDSGVKWIGMIPEHWKIMRLRFVCEFRNGYTPSKANPKFWENGTIPWFRMEDIRDSGRFLNEAKQYISKEAVKGDGLFEAGSFILATTATIGEHAMLIADSLANQRFTNLKIRKSLISKLSRNFFFYYLFVIDEYCKSTTRKATFPSVDMTDLKNIGVSIPPIEEQQEIVTYLDSKVANINQLCQAERSQIEKLKEYKQRLISDVVTGKVKVTND